NSRVPHPCPTRRSSDLYAVGLKKDLTAMLTGAKVKTTPVNIFGTADRAAIDLVVMGTSQDSAMQFAKKAMAELQNIDGAMAVKRSEEHTTELQSREKHV